MIKTLYAVHIATILLFCHVLAPYAGNDIALYVFSLLIALPLLQKYRLASKEFVSHFLGIQSLAMWGCYFFLDQPYQLVTESLKYIKGLLLSFIIFFEFAAAIHMFRRYRAARRELRLFSCESFAYAICPYPLIPALQKLFVVEFNIWRALLVRFGFVRDQDGRDLKQVTKINPGYRASHARFVLAAFIVLDLFCTWLIQGWWLALPFLATFYFSLLINSETLSFKRHAIYDAGPTLKIPNGMYGFVSVEKQNIDEVLAGHEVKEHGLSVSRLVPGNILMRLVEPVMVFGERVKTISLCVDDASLVEKACRLECAPAHRHKVVLVTGGSRGIGAELVKQLDRTRFEVWVAGRGLPEACEADDRFFAVDFSDSVAVERFLGELRGLGRRIDILVNNAATVSDAVLEPHGLSENYIVNVQSPSRITEFLQMNRMLDCVINVVSGNGYLSRDPASLPRLTGVKGYFETKYRFVQIQKHLARKYQTHCLFFSPGPTNTRIQVKIIDSFIRRRSPSLARMLNWLNAFTLHNAGKTSLGLSQLCVRHLEIDAFSTVHSSGKVEKPEDKAAHEANELAYAQL